LNNYFPVPYKQMGGACSSDGGREGCTRFWWGNLKERGHWGDPGVDGRIILRRIELAEDRYRWRVFVNPLMNLRVP
jgi:hypothetical protein